MGRKTRPSTLKPSGLFSSLRASTVDDQGRIARPPDALRPLTLCNCNCEILTAAIAQRCVSAGQHLRDWYFCPCPARYFIDCFACAYPSVNHDWILRVLRKAGLPASVQNFLRSFCEDNITAVDYAGKIRGHFLWQEA